MTTVASSIIHRSRRNSYYIISVAESAPLSSLTFRPADGNCLLIMPGQDSSFVFFADEQAPADSLLFGGYLMRRHNLSALDDGVAAAKRDVGLSNDAPVKASPPKDDIAYQAQRELSPEKRRALRCNMLQLLSQLKVVCFFSMIWKYKSKDTAKTYCWAFTNVIQRLSIQMERSIGDEQPDAYPGLDVVVDWFPEPNRRDDYFSVYNSAYHKGFTFGENVLPALKKFGACPCLLVTSCRFSPALQLADFCVGTMGRMLRWAYEPKNNRQFVTEMSEYVQPVTRHLLRVDNQVLGYGLVPPKGAAARNKISEALTELSI